MATLGYLFLAMVFFTITFVLVLFVFDSFKKKDIGLGIMTLGLAIITGGITALCYDEMLGAAEYSAERYELEYKIVTQGEESDTTYVLKRKQ